MEIRRFGYGRRRPDGPPGSHGVQGALIHGAPEGSISELAFSRRAVIEPHVSVTSAWFVVIEGGGFVRVGDETARVFAGEAVLWPAGVLHGASTDVSEMRAIVVEFGESGDAAVPLILPGTVAGPRSHEESPAPGPGSGSSGAAGPAKGEGSLAPDGRPAHGYDRSEGEPV